jgi:DNA-binding CsgD family transcriptional regulator/tetratricopeptide (TPR) repeat protein
MAWSYELCTPEQRLLWARSSVFAGGFDAAMAEAVCADAALPSEVIFDCIYDLVGKSILVREESGGRVRFRVLETIREFGQGMLSDAERAELYLRHLACCSRLMADSVEQWFGAGQVEVAERLRANLANVRTALQTALSRKGDPGSVSASDLVSLPWWLWACGLSAREHTMWLEQVLTIDGLDDRHRARAFATLGMVLTLQGDRESANGNVEQALELAGRAGDPIVTAFATNARGLSAFFGGDLVRAEALLKEAIDRYARQPEARADLVCTPHVHLGMLLSFDGRTAEAAECFELVRRRSEGAGERWMQSYAMFGLGLVALAEERYTDAAELARASLRLKRDFADSVGTPLAIELLGWAEAGAGSAGRAAVLLGAASALWGAFGQHLYGSDQWMQRRARFEEWAHAELGEGRFAECEAQGAAMSPAELMDLAEGAPPAAARRPHVRDDLLAHLSPREREVARHVADGLSNKGIAEALVLSHRTIEGHVEHILHKLGLQNRHQLAVAVARGEL